MRGIYRRGCTGSGYTRIHTINTDTHGLHGLHGIHGLHGSYGLHGLYGYTVNMKDEPLVV